MGRKSTYKDNMNPAPEEKEKLLSKLKDNLIGRQFDRLTVIDFVGMKNHKSMWECVCNCGNEEHRIVSGSNLLGGISTSCGKCKRSESKLIDITGQKFGKLTVLKLDHVEDNGAHWLVQCDCNGPNSLKVVCGLHLKNGNITSCGCAKIHDLTGQKFGRLTVIGLDHVGKPGDGAFWKCKCDCDEGNIVIVRGNSLVSGNTKSCGCLNQELRFNRAIHGDWKSPLYRTWIGMKSRCNNSNNTFYKNYGGRGIKVCPEWNKPGAEGYLAFKRDMGDSYKPGLTINRIDNDGDYCKENCNWITNQEQQFNKTTTCYVEFFGENICASEIARRYTDNPQDISMICQRLYDGWSVEEAVKIPNLNDIGSTKNNYLKTHKVIKKPICFENEDPFYIPDVVKLSDIINIKED